MSETPRSLQSEHQSGFRFQGDYPALNDRTAPEQAKVQEVSMYWLLAVLLLRWRVVASLLSVSILGVLAGSLLLPRQYTTRVSFVPSSAGTAPSQLAGLASQFGLSLPMQDGAVSPGFYENLIGTTEMLRTIATHKYHIASADSVSRSLAHLYEIDDTDSNEALDETIEMLEKRVIDASSDPQTGVIRVDVRSRWPELSEQIAALILREVNRFNLQTRQAQALAQQQFLRARRDTADLELRQTEEALKSFLERNRTFRDDPRLLFEHERLTRAVQVRQSLFLSLTEAFEQHRLEALRNTPSIAIVEPPRLALRADKRHLPLRLVSAVFAGLLLSIVVILLSQIAASSRRQHAGDARFFEDAKSQTMNELRRVMRRIAGR